MALALASAWVARALLVDESQPASPAIVASSVAQTTEAPRDAAATPVAEAARDEVDSGAGRLVGYCPPEESQRVHELALNELSAVDPAATEPLVAALRAAPSSHAAAFALATHTLALTWRLGGEASAGAITELRRYAHRNDGDVEVGRLLARFELFERFEASARTVTVRGVTLVYSGAKTTDREAFDVARLIADAVDDAAQITHSPPRRELRALLYVSRAVFHAATCARDWVGAFHRRGVLHLAYPALDSHDLPLEQIRHEVMHAQIHSAAPTAPRWFHEGLAYAHGKPERVARARQVVQQARQPIAYDQLDARIANAATFDALAHAEAIALVEFLRRHGGPTAIRAALDRFRVSTSPSEVIPAVTGLPTPTWNELIR